MWYKFTFAVQGKLDSLYFLSFSLQNHSSASLSYARYASSVKAQDETYPVQESGIKEDRRCNLDQLQEYMGMIFNNLFPCFELLERPKEYSNTQANGKSALSTFYVSDLRQY